MKATDTIRASMQTAKDFAVKLFADMENAPLMRTCPQHGNHPYWILGHIVVSEATLLDQCILGQPNRHAAWESKFKFGTQPEESMNGGPSYCELMDAWEGMRAATLEYLDSIQDADLSAPCHQGVEGPPFETVGECLNAMVIHTSFHAGQVADARRAAGRTPVFL